MIEEMTIGAANVHLFQAKHHEALKEQYEQKGSPGFLLLADVLTKIEAAPNYHSLVEWIEEENGIQ